MKPTLLITLGLISLLTSCASKIINTDGLLTLLYYPDCDYQVLGVVTGVDGYTAYEYVEKKLEGTLPFVFKADKGDQQKALYQLKKNAIELGADAIAITSYKNLTGTETASTGGKFKLNKYIYQAKAIKLCEKAPLKGYNAWNDKPVRYDEAGNVTLGNLKESFKLKPIFSDLAEVEEQTPPMLTNFNISTSGNIYGLPLGTTKDTLIATFDAPSAIIQQSESKQLFQYDRRHLFYLIDDILVAYEYKDWYLPPHISNRVLFHRQFEEIKWKIDGSISLGNTLKEVKSIYQDQLIQKSSEKYALTNENANIDFSFHKSKNPITDEPVFKLASVKVSKPNTSFMVWDEMVNNQRIIHTIDIESSKLPIKPNDTKSIVKSTLGEPKAIILGTNSKLTWVYNNEFSINFFSDKVFSYSFEKSPYTQTISKCESCLYLGQDVAAIPEKYIIKRSDFEYLLENDGVSYSLDIVTIGGIKQIAKIKISSTI